MGWHAVKPNNLFSSRKKSFKISLFIFIAHLKKVIEGICINFVIKSRIAKRISSVPKTFLGIANDCHSDLSCFLLCDSDYQTQELTLK